MIAWWVWAAWMATVCVAVGLGVLVNEWHTPGRRALVPVRLRRRHDARGR